MKRYSVRMVDARWPGAEVEKVVAEVDEKGVSREKKVVTHYGPVVSLARELRLEAVDVASVEAAIAQIFGAGFDYVIEEVDAPKKIDTRVGGK